MISHEIGYEVTVATIENFISITIKLLHTFVAYYKHYCNLNAESNFLASADIKPLVVPVCLQCCF